MSCFHKWTKNSKRKCFNCGIYLLDYIKQNNKQLGINPKAGKMIDKRKAPDA